MEHTPKPTSKAAFFFAVTLILAGFVTLGTGVGGCNDIYPPPPSGFNTWTSAAQVEYLKLEQEKQLARSESAAELTVPTGFTNWPHDIQTKYMWLLAANNLSIIPTNLWAVGAIIAFGAGLALIGGLILVVFCG